MAAEGVIVVDGHAAGDSGVEQVTVQELEMGGMNRHDNARTFAALILMDRYGIR